MLTLLHCIKHNLKCINNISLQVKHEPVFIVDQATYLNVNCMLML